MNRLIKKSQARIAAAALLLLLPAHVLKGESASADSYELEWGAEAVVNGGNGEFAPYYIASNRHGMLTQSKDALLRASVARRMNVQERFSYGFGADIAGGYSSSAPYMRYEDDTWMAINRHPSRFWIQQLYGEIKYRGVFLTAGLKEHESALLDYSLSSGDLVESGNARPIPEIRAGFHDFQNIPFTKGWLQIQGELSYGKPTDNAWVRDHYNYYNQEINQGALYSYKRCYFRTNPEQPFSVTFGMQAGAFFGGKTTWYRKGAYDGERHFSKGIKQFFKMLIPTDGGVEYYSGSSLGSWDVLLRYRFRNGMTLKGYMQKPWEDGSGIGFLNGFDGLWGVELKTNRRGAVTGAVVEYLDFTNQSGAMHWDPDDHSGTGIRHRAEGADNYYNNHEYNAYAYYGMSIGTPFLKAPIYNSDGCIQYLHNRMRGFHIGVTGEIGNDVTYRILGGYRKSYGSGFVPLIDPADDTSLLVEATYNVPAVRGLSVKGQIGIDRGTLFGNVAGGCVTVSYRGLLKL